MDATDPRDLSLALILLRRVRDWTQEEMATATGLSASTICEYETGKTAPSSRNLGRILVGLRFPPPLFDALLALLASVRRVMTACQAISAGNPTDSLESIAADAGRATAEFLRAEVSLALAGLAPSGQSPSTADIRAASDLRARLEPFSNGERLGLIRNGEQFRSWALAVQLCDESVEQAAHKPRPALELAEMALEIARLAPIEPTFRSRLIGYVLAFVGNARRVGGDLPESEVAFLRSREAWPADLAEENGLLDGSRRYDLEASLRTSQRRFPEALQLLDLALAECPQRSVGRILVIKAKAQEELGDYESAIATLAEADGGRHGGRTPGLRAPLQPHRQPLPPRAPRRGRGDAPAGQRSRGTPRQRPRPAARQLPPGADRRRVGQDGRGRDDARRRPGRVPRAGHRLRRRSGDARAGRRARGAGTNGRGPGARRLRRRRSSRHRVSLAKVLAPSPCSARPPPRSASLRSWRGGSSGTSAERNGW